MKKVWGRIKRKIVEEVGRRKRVVEIHRDRKS